MCRQGYRDIYYIVLSLD